MPVVIPVEDRPSGRAPARSLRRSCGSSTTTDGASGPASIAALRDAILKGCEPPAARIVASLASYRWFVVGTVCIGAVMGQLDASIAQLLLPRLELEFS